jgi:hypothetical protein
MNWTCVIYGGPMLLVMCWWVVDARKWFKGPRINIEDRMLGRDGAIIRSQDVRSPASGVQNEKRFWPRRVKDKVAPTDLAIGERVIFTTGG